MDVYEAIAKRRSVRRFEQESISRQQLVKFVEAARVAPQTANLQPMKYVIIDDVSILDTVFAATKWAAYLKDAAPAEDERPTAYMLALVDTDIMKASYDTDAGAAIENLILAATADGIGTCWLGALNRNALKEILDISDKYIIHSMVALGYPKEEPVTVDAADGIKYYRDESGVHHVPKRKLEDIVFYNKLAKR